MNSPMTLKKSLKESGLEIGWREVSSGMEAGGVLLVGTPLGTREKKLSRLGRPPSLLRTMESEMHCSKGLSRASSY